MARLTISIPDKLKERMEKVKEKASWSKVAAAAFEKRITEIEAQLEKDKEISMETAIERLKASKKYNKHSIKGVGFLHGQNWAKRYAEYEELERLNNLDEKQFHLTLPDGYTAADLVSMTVMDVDKDNYEKSHGDELWTQVGVDGEAEYAHSSPEFVEGFVEGTLSVYNEVKQHLN